MKIEGSASGSGSICQRHGYMDPDPDPHQNVMDPQDCFQVDLEAVRLEHESRPRYLIKAFQKIDQI
jgi:hypothetical protein